MTLTSVELSPRMGSSVTISKAELVSGARAQEIRALLDQRGVLLFRGLSPTDDELRTIARTLGDLRIGTAKRGSEAVQNTIRGMDEMREQIQETAKRIKRQTQGEFHHGHVDGYHAPRRG